MNWFRKLFRKRQTAAEATRVILDFHAEQEAQVIREMRALAQAGADVRFHDLMSANSPMCRAAHRLVEEGLWEQKGVEPAGHGYKNWIYGPVQKQAHTTH